MSTKENFAVVFPGQGSQTVGMLADYADTEIVRTTFSDASEALGYDVWECIVDGPQEKLNLTEITQPILLTSSVALWRLWQEKNGCMPKFLAGHSLGEWSALTCADVISLSDAVKLVRSRGKYMQEAVPAGEGAMAAIIGLEDEVVEKVCGEAAGDGVVSAVNYNTPGQLVIAGSADAVDRAIVACKDAGAKRAMPLAVSAPFHTSLMKPAADRLSVEIEATEFKAPSISIVHNVNALPEASPEKIKALMVEQIFQPVKWVSCIQYLRANGVESILECGPGKVLSGMNRRIDKTITSYASEKMSSLDASVEALLN